MTSLGTAGSLRGHSLSLQTIFDGYTLANTDTSVCAYGVGSLLFRCQPDTSACFSELSTPVRSVSLSIYTCAILITTFLPPT